MVGAYSAGHSGAGRADEAVSLAGAVFRGPALTEQLATILRALAGNAARAQLQQGAAAPPLAEAASPFDRRGRGAAAGA